MSYNAPSFAEATAVRQVSGKTHEYSAHFKDEFCIGTVPHGGYVTSIFAQVARLHFQTTLKQLDQPDTMTMQLSFLRRTSVGPALFTVKDSKTGRQTSTIHISLSQPDSGKGKSPDPREEVVAYITQTNFDREQGLSVGTGWSLQPPVGAPVDLAKLSSDQDANWGLLKDPPFPKFRKACMRTRWFLPRSRTNTFTGSDVWMGLSSKNLGSGASGDGSKPSFERWTNTSLGFISDLFPQIVEDTLAPETYRVASTAGQRSNKNSVGASFWYPTVVLNLEIKKRLPDEGVEFLFQRVRAKCISNGRYDLEVVVMDNPHGDVIALSHHAVLLLTAERNLSGRGKTNSSESKSIKL